MLGLGVVVACSSDPVASSPTDAGTSGGDAASGDGGGGGGTCAADQLLGPVDAVSAGDVAVLSDTGGVKTLFVDAAAGGPQGAATSPRVYLNLESATRVAVTDKAARASQAWDLALKRPILFTNSGDGGSGQGGAVLVPKAFDAVTPADAASASPTPERFFGANCAPELDQTGAVKTSFDGWYEYDTATNGLSPRAGTWLVKGATGKLYKVQIVTYYAMPDGGVGQAGGRYTLKVGAL